MGKSYFNLCKACIRTLKVWAWNYQNANSIMTSKFLSSELLASKVECFYMRQNLSPCCTKTMTWRFSLAYQFFCTFDTDETYHVVHMLQACSTSLRMIHFSCRQIFIFWNRFLFKSTQKNWHRAKHRLLWFPVA